MAATNATPVHLMFGKAEVTVFASAMALFNAAADEFFRVIYDALERRGVCRIALAGGSTPKSLYAILADRVNNSQARGIDWARVHLFLGDERCVPSDHPDSNYRMVRNSLLSHGLTAAIHRVETELPPDEAAARYEENLREHFGNGVPAFDLIVLGLGPDGHTASLFPGSPALGDNTRWVAANYVEKFKGSRITFTYRVLNNSTEALFLVIGAEKADALAQVLAGGNLPAARVQPQGRLLWYVDGAAAISLLGKKA